ncbi:MAG: lysozyme inhibitor LprI family protein [Pyrinomonadaceae bacterium]
MKNKIILILILCIALLLAAACQKAQQAVNDAEDLTSTESPVINPTNKELEAVRTPCDETGSQQDAENCAKTEFEKSEAEMNQLYQKVLTNLQNFEQKARPQDKILADKYKKDRENMQTAQKAWLAFRDADCIAEKESDANDNNNAMIGFSCQQRLTENRTDDLKLIYENK